MHGDHIVLKSPWQGQKKTQYIVCTVSMAKTYIEGDFKSNKKEADFASQSLDLDYFRAGVAQIAIKPARPQAKS